VRKGEGLHSGIGGSIDIVSVLLIFIAATQNYRVGGSVFSRKELLGGFLKGQSRGEIKDAIPVT